MSLTKVDLAEMLFERIGFGKCEAREVVNSFFNELCLVLAQGESIKLSGFGRFEVRYKRERAGRNPRTGEPLIVSSRRVIVFHPSKILKTMVQAYDATE